MRLPQSSFGFRLVAHESEIGKFESRPDGTADQSVTPYRPGRLPLSRGDDVYRFPSIIERP